MGSMEVISREEWRRAVKCRMGTCDFELLDYKVKPLGGTSGGFLGEHSLVEVTVRLQNSKEPEKVLHFFLKGEPRTNPDQKQIIEESNSFVKEVNSLSNLFVQLRSVLENGGKGMEWTCKCFYTRPDVIILEDLVHQGYRLVGGRETMGYKRCALVMKALANLHSASLIFEESRPQPYRLDEEYGEILSEGFFRDAPNHPGRKWQDAGVRVMKALVRLHHGEEAFKRIEDKLEKAMGSFLEFEKTSKRFRNVVNHGDLWKNNMFFLHEEGDAKAARLVDFQLVRYAPPANDISCFLYLTTDRAFREEYASKLYALYHRHLAGNLKRHGLDVEEVLPWMEFKESCDFYKKMGVIIIAHYGTVVMLKPDALTHVFASSEEFDRFLMRDRTPEVIPAFKNDNVYRAKMIEVMEELIEECVQKEFQVK